MILLSFQENFGVFNWKTNDGLLSWRPMNFNYPCLVVTLRRNSVAGAKPPCDAAYGEPRPGPGLTLAMAEVSLNLRNNVNQPLINNMLKNWDNCWISRRGAQGCGCVARRRDSLADGLRSQSLGHFAAGAACKANLPEHHPARDGGAERNRTADLLIANEALYQLSYGPRKGAE